MKKIIKIGIAIAILLTAMTLAILSVTHETKADTEQIVVIEEPKITITHAQDVWINALEWCESRGNPANINPKDKDNTPSYYSFQFKPGTFRSYGEKYEIIEKGLKEEVLREKMKDQKTQRKIVENMLQDKSVIWRNQFPDCVRNKIGYPPNY
jgi:hypothetical protein